MTASPLVLVVDDDLALRDLIHQVLVDVGYRTIMAADGAAALRIIRRTDLDLVLLDVNMPVMDGLAFLRQRSDEHCHLTVPVVVMSAEDREAEARRVGAADFLPKPFDIDALLDLVEQHVHSATT